VAIAPAVLVLVVLLWFPETARRELEDLNPFDRPLDPPAVSGRTDDAAT